MKVVLYSTHCPQCIVLEKKLQAKGISYEEINDMELMIQKGYVSAPVLEVDGESMSFKDSVEWVNNQ